MVNQLLQRIADWNRDRNNLQFKRQREIDMLNEEIYEATKAKYMSNLAKELADVVFVAYGSLVKYAGSPQKANEILDIVITHNENKGSKKDKNGKIVKVKQPKCEPLIKEVLDRKLAATELEWRAENDNTIN